MNRFRSSGHALLLLPGALVAPSCDFLTAPGDDPRLDEVDYALVSAGGVFSCGLSREGQAFCWGNNRSAQLGAGPAAPLINFFHPVPVAGSHRFTSIAAGGTHACALDAAGAPYCWGSDFFGQLGLGAQGAPNACRGSPCAASPIRVSGDRRFRSVHARETHTCGLTPEGDVYCWGGNRSGQLGTGQFGDPITAPTRVRTDESVRFVQVSLGRSHTCALSDEGRLYCWGSNEWGQLGAETEALCGEGPPGACSTMPLHAAGGLEFRAVSAGVHHTCGLTDDGAVYCWGLNDSGTLGVPPDSTIEPCGARTEPWTCSAEPVRVSGDVTFEFLSAGGWHTCGLTVGGDGHCWGWNMVGTLGDCTARGWISEPVPMCGGRRFVHLDGGVTHHCGVSVDGVAYCWGGNDSGELGSTTLAAFGPVRVVRPRNVTQDGS